MKLAIKTICKIIIIQPQEQEREINGRQIMGAEVSFVITGAPLITIVYIGDQNRPRVETHNLENVQIFIHGEE